ncbi:regulator of ribosome biosynthesis [Lipomyces orientalis]|uniref:Regulator of ribosome biosynthesis n=1 Tax=Lipomyces orientalis TaxID=1233043 RepID=A0ACC3TKH5_9ASCO
MSDSTTTQSVGSRPVTVQRAVPVTYDLGNLAVFDTNMMDPEIMSSADEAKREEYLWSLARDSAQLLVNQVLALPIVTGGRTGGDVKHNDGVFVKLPDPTTQLPREKPVPVPKPLTKWEKFAKQKGITPKARNSGNLVYDEAKGEWVKKWGYKGKNQEIPWLVEVDENTEKGGGEDSGKSESKSKRAKRSPK